MTQRFLLLTAAALSLPFPVLGGGIQLYEIATPDVGMAAAGYAARAEDASTVFKNPAGMNQLDNAQLQAGLQALYGSVSFSPDANTSARLGTDGGGNAVGWLPAGSAFVVMPVAAKWRIGFGALSYFGLAEDYGDNWVGRYYVQAGVENGGTTTLNLEYQDTFHGALGAQFRASEKWLVSSGFAYDSSAVSDGKRTVTLPLGEAWRLGVGTQYQVSKTITLGAAYTFLWQGNLPVDQGTDASLRGRVSGAFDDVWISVLSLNLTWEF